MSARQLQVLIGTIGYYPFVRAYPLGPEYMQRLQAINWSTHIVIKEMNWGPIAIVQDLQADPVDYDRVVLVGAVERGDQTGTVSCRRWQHEPDIELDPIFVQQRVYEGVTGVISVDNLLVIGEYFKVWPEQVIIVEVEWPEQLLSDLIFAESADGSTSTVIGEKPLSPANEHIVERLITLTERAVVEEIDKLADLPILAIDRLKPTGVWCQYQF